MPLEPPAWLDDAPHPGDKDAPNRDNIHVLRAPPVLSPAAARWLGVTAARLGGQAIEAGRELAVDALEAYEEGLAMPEGARVPCPVSDAERKSLVRRLGKEAATEDVLPVTITHLRQRKDIGTATRYDIRIVMAGRPEADLRDLRAVDLLSWYRFRIIAADARLVLPPLSRAGAPAWMEAVQAAMDTAELAELSPEESEAMEIRAIVSDLIDSARAWAWAEDDAYPVGLVRIEDTGRHGWPRGPIMRELRVRLGKVSRVATSRAVLSLGLTAQEWRVGERSIRVWCRSIP